jgi:hypothetical protein
VGIWSLTYYLVASNFLMSIQACSIISDLHQQSVANNNNVRGSWNARDVNRWSKLGEFCSDQYWWDFDPLLPSCICIIFDL